MRLQLIVIFVVVLLFRPITVKGTDVINPIEYGLNQVNDGESRYKILLKCHQEAVRLSQAISYKGIDTIRIEIPFDAEPIPLADITDFAGAVIIVTNNNFNFTLFQKKNHLEEFDITWKDIVSNQLPNGDYVILVTDDNPWVDQRSGYNYGYSRDDLIYVKNGKVKNNVIATYDNLYSRPRFKRFQINGRKTLISNLKLVRNTGNLFVTNVLELEQLDNIELSSIFISTPTSILFGDAAITLHNCTNISMKDVTIDGTYSQLNRYGYGISLKNVYNITIDNLKGRGNWGVFGNYGVNKAFLKNCDINRFDIHCYGRDISFKNCTFRDLYNQFSSIYGTVRFKKCTFIDFTPVLLEPSYNAYTPFDVEIYNCTWYLTTKRRYLINAGNPYDNANKRYELSIKNWPNVKVKNLKLINDEGVGDLYLFCCVKRNDREKAIIGNLNKIRLAKIHLTNESKKPQFYLSNEKIKVINKLTIKQSGEIVINEYDNIVNFK